MCNGRLAVARGDEEAGCRASKERYGDAEPDHGGEEEKAGELAVGATDRVGESAPDGDGGCFLGRFSGDCVDVRQFR